MAQYFWPVTSTGGGPTGPQIVQSVQLQGDYNSAQAYNNFVFNFNEPVGAGNCLLLINAQDTDQAAGHTLSSISDSVNGSWSTTPIKSCVGTNGRIDAFVFPNSVSGSPNITVSYTGGLSGPKFMIFEIAGVATSSPFDGGSANPDQTYGGSTAITCGSFTPGHNNALVLAFFVTSTGFIANGVVTSFSATSGFTLYSSDNGWTSANNGLNAASTYQIQTTATSVNPGISPTGDTVDTFNCLAISLKGSAGSGTARPSGIYIARRQLFVDVSLPTAWTHQFPTVGNLRVLVNPFTDNYTSVTDSEGNTWTLLDTSGTTAQFFYLQNASPNPNLTVTSHGPGTTDQSHHYMFDIVGAATSNVTGADAYNTTSTGANQTVVNHMPDITPTKSGSRVIVYAPDGLGPVFSVTSPSNAVFYNCRYSGETDSGYYNSGDGWAGFSTTPAQVGVSQSFNWTIKSDPSGGLVAHAVEFKGP